MQHGGIILSAPVPWVFQRLDRQGARDAKEGRVFVVQDLMIKTPVALFASSR
jgi:hypothetical protein